MLCISLVLARLGLCLPAAAAAAAFQELQFPPTARRRRCYQGDPTTTPAARANVCQPACPAADVDSLLGLPTMLSLPTQKKQKKNTHAAPSLYHFTLNALSAPLLSFRFVSFFLALNPNTAHGIVCFCFLGLLLLSLSLPTQLLPLLVPFA